MRKTIAILLLAVVGMGIQPAAAQIKLGVVGGLNVTKVDYKHLSSNYDSKNRAGWFIGPKVEAHLPLVGIGVDAAVLYSQRGISTEETVDVNSGTGSIATTDGTTTYTSTSQFRTIEIPINLRYQFGFSSLVAVYVATGPQFGFNVGSGSFENFAHTKFKYKNSILSYNIGAGVKLLKHLEAGIGYNFPLTKFAKVTGTSAATSSPYDSKSSFKAGTFQLHVGYFF